MNKIAILSGILMICLMFAGCGQASSNPGFDDEDLTLDVEGTQYSLNVGIDDVISGLGEDYAYSEARSCDYDGLDKTFLYDVAEFYTYPLPEGDAVSEIYTEDPEVTTSKGISVGATKEDVLSLYGNDCEDTGYQLIYSLPGEQQGALGGSLCFDLENDAVTAIYITTRPF